MLVNSGLEQLEMSSKRQVGTDMPMIQTGIHTGYYLKAKQDKEENEEG